MILIDAPDFQFITPNQNWINRLFQLGFEGIQPTDDQIGGGGR